MKNEVFQELLKGEKIKGYVKEIRPDGKIDISLRKTGNGPIGRWGRKDPGTFEIKQRPIIRSRQKLPGRDTNAPADEQKEL